MKGNLETAIGQGWNQGDSGPALADPGDGEGEDLADGSQRSDGNIKSLESVLLAPNPHQSISLLNVATASGILEKITCICSVTKNDLRNNSIDLMYPISQLSLRMKCKTNKVAGHANGSLLRVQSQCAEAFYAC